MLEKLVSSFISLHMSTKCNVVYIKLLLHKKHWTFYTIELKKVKKNRSHLSNITVPTTCLIFESKCPFAKSYLLTEATESKQQNRENPKQPRNP